MPTSREVAGQIDSLNRRNIEPMPMSLLRAAKASQVYVFNVGPESWVRTVGTGTYVVQGKRKDQAYSDPVILDSTIYTTVPTDTGFTWKPSDGMDVARDIVQINLMSDYTRYGVGISETWPPSEEQVAQLAQARVDMLAQRVRDADEYYAVNGGMVTVTVNGQQITRSNIQDAHRSALQELGWSRDWALKNIQMAQCWNCGRSVLPTSAKCFNEGCGAPLKNEDAKARFIAGDEDEPVRRRKAS